MQQRKNGRSHQLTKGRLMKTPDAAQGFQRVDRSAKPEFFIRFVDESNRIPAIISCKRRMLKLLRLEPGHRVLDVGSGTGDDARALAEIVGKGGGLTIGVDISEAMLAEARQRAEGKRLSLDFRSCDGRRLDFPDSDFDRCRADRTLMHAEDPRELLGEMVRVLRPGGRVVIFDFDWDTLAIDSPNRELTRRIVRLASNEVRNGWVGRQLPALMRGCGLKEVSIFPHTVISDLHFLMLFLEPILDAAQSAGSLNADHVALWRGKLEEADRMGRFFAALGGFIAVGEKYS
jgi:ubiquinone/menaquinone biosynthesis C-methylase UbiE